MGFQTSPSQSGDDQESVGFSYIGLVIDTARKLRDAGAEKDLEKFAFLADFAIQLLICYYPTRLRFKLDEDKQDLKRRELVVWNNPELHDETKTLMVAKMRADWANDHLGAFFSAFNRVGFVKVKDEGVIDWQDEDFSGFSHVVRKSTHSVQDTVQVRGEDVALDEHGQPLPAPGAQG